MSDKLYFSWQDKNANKVVKTHQTKFLLGVSDIWYYNNILKTFEKFMSHGSKNYRNGVVDMFGHTLVAQHALYEEAWPLLFLCYWTETIWNLKWANEWCVVSSTSNLTTILEPGFLWHFVRLSLKTCSLYHEKLFIQKFKDISSQQLFFSLWRHGGCQRPFLFL